jgi:uncharacterized protein (TIGR02147 family)
VIKLKKWQKTLIFDIFILRKAKNATNFINQIIMINVFEYQNYRSYLGDYYKEQKEKKRNFSYKSFSEKAGIAAPSFLFYVIKNKRNLTKNTVAKISAAMSHTREEADYFENLVFFNQTETISEKTLYYGRLVEVRKPLDISKITTDRYEFYSKWYHSVIREVVTFFDFKDDFGLLGSFLIPAIGSKEARGSVLLLERLGFIERDRQGLYHQTENLVFAKAGASDSFVLDKFQIEMLSVAMKAYDLVPVRDRMSSATTFSISRETFELFKMRMRELQQQLMEMARIDDKPGRAYQLNLNLFPVCKESADKAGGNDKK